MANAYRGASMPFLTRLFLLVSLVLSASILAGGGAARALTPGRAKLDPAIEAKVDALLKRMTLEEKIGQLNFPSYGYPRDAQLEAVRRGRIGAMLNVAHADHVQVFRDAAAASRLKIPLIFAIDSIFSFRIAFPVPIAWAATWEPKLAESATEAIARETAAIGVNLTFAPMVDISRDPRWGRVIEGAGEDAVLGAAFAAARVTGYRKGGLATAAKHFVGYGAPEGGRDYNGAQISMPELLDRYVPPFKAAIEAGSETVMASFNTVNGVPVTAERRLVTDLLKTKLGFDGIVMSDFAAITELANHGVAADFAEAARKALHAGVDLDMEGKAYDQFLANEISSGRVPVAEVDAAARRILRTKYRMGLFDEKPAALGGPKPGIEDAEVRSRAREVARQSFVLLKNDREILPLAKSGREIAVIGAAGTTVNDHSWYGPAGLAKPETQTLIAALEPRLAARGARMTYTRGFKDDCGQSFDDKAAAVKAVRAADIGVLIVTEDCNVSGEGASRTDLSLSGVQQEMLEALSGTGRPIVLVIETGRPLTLVKAAENAAAILVVWHPGTEGRTALAEVLTGEVVPSGKLPMTFPRSVGQIPLAYNELPTSRPANGSRYTTGYVDEDYTPLYPFGFGLSYTTFGYSDLKIAKPMFDADGANEISVTLENKGTRDGAEVVQLYTHQHVGERSRPLRELRAFRKVWLRAGEKKVVTFTLAASALAHHNDEGRAIVEPGKYTVFVGGSSAADLKGGFEISAR